MAIISAAGAIHISKVLGEAIEGAKSVNDDNIADYLRSHEFKTIMGNVRFGKDGPRHHRRREPGDVERHELPDGAHPCR